MILQSIEFESYKSFPNRQKMVIKPLTIVIGKNSSGKSAFSRLPLLLANSFLPESEEPITVNYNGIEFGGSFKDLIYNKLPHGSLKMTLSFSDETIICFEVQNINGTPIQMINKWSIESTNINISFEIVLTEDNIISSRDTEYTANGKSYLVTFQGLVPINIEFPDKEYDSRDIELLKESLYNFSRNVEYIGPYRQIPQRVYFHSGRSPSKLGVKGENAPQILGSASFRNKDLVSNVGDWYEKYLGGWRIEVEHVGEFFQVVLVSPDDSSVKVNIVDVGQGMSQILPLVVQCLTRTKVSNAISIIEQPELHLHPAAHGDLAELFAKSAMADGGRYILETHSENIILRIRRLIVQGILSSKDVIIYWIDDGNRPGSQVREIQIDEDGELSDWPKGVFSEDYEEVLAIREAQKTKNADTDKS